MASLIFIFVITMTLVIIGARTFIFVKEGEGVAVFRLGRLLRVSRPGLVIVFPFLDNIVRVSLQGVARWETMPEEELKKKIMELAESKHM